MTSASREFQIFAKPAGSICNLDCHYCYYINKDQLYPEAQSFCMSDEILEEYIVQHIETSPTETIRFSWHGGEPTVLGLEYFRKIVELQQKYEPANKLIANGIQTNGTLLDDQWCQFLADEKFAVGLSLDGPRELHDIYRLSKAQRSSFDQTMRGHSLLQRCNVNSDILCVVNAGNVQHPLKVYRFFKEIGARYISFLPLVELRTGSRAVVNDRTVPAEAFGAFLCTIYDEWMARDIGKVKIQIFEEAAGTAFGQEHSLCIFRETCGDVPVIEHNGDFYSCDHYVEPDFNLGNITERPLVELLESSEQRSFGQAKLRSLPEYCKECEVRNMCNGGCPKNRFIQTPDGKDGLNYLCAGYKRFFNHCKPFVEELAILARKQTNNIQPHHMQSSPKGTNTRVGRNDPCPCGSGRKFKKCCLGKA